MLSLHLTTVFLVFYLKILNVACNGNSSLIYVIDDTYSMHDDIRQVKIGSVQVLNDVLEAKSTEVANIVLITFNDPDVRVRAITRDPTEFKNALNQVHIYGGGDCPELSMAGIIEGLRRGLPNSYMYVFTDASAKDFYRVREVTDLCIKKQTQIIFLLTGHCGNPASSKYRVYYDIAAKCSGQVFVFDKRDVSEFLQTIRATINDKKTIVKSVTVPPNFFATPIRFTLDDKTDYAIVSASGKNVDVSITRDGFGPQINTERLMGSSNVKIIKLHNDVPGDYIAWVLGTSDVSVAIYAKTDFTFEHGFSEIAPKSLADTSNRPIADKNQHLSIHVTDPDRGVNINHVNILSPNLNILKSIPLKHVDGDFYITNKFVSPKSPFIIQVKGTNKQTGTPIYRNSRTVIEPIEPIPQVPEKPPEVSISEGSQTDVKYDGSIVLRCRVSAYPEPTIMWYGEDFSIMKSNRDVVDLPYDFISYLHLQNVTKSKNYFCRARNKLNNISRGIRVNVMSPFEVTKVLPAITNVKYEEPITLNCGIKSDLPIRRTWFSDKINELSAKGIKLDSDNEEFVINSMDIDLQGAYGCKVWLESNPKLAKEQHTILRIDNVSPPSITSTQNIFNDTFTATCLTTGIPKPSVTWYYAKDMKGPFSGVGVSGEELKLENVNMNHIGIYKCIAENAVGKREETFNLAEEAVIKKKAPEVSIIEGSQIDVKYDGSVLLKCRVSAYPAPTIMWHAEDGTVIKSNRDFANSPYDFISYLHLRNVTKSQKYLCGARNKLGFKSSAIQINVMSPFKIIKELSAQTNVKYEKPVTINCGIQSDLPTKRSWFSDKNKQLSAKGINLNNNNDELVINSMDIDLQGRYGCRVWLESNPKVVTEQQTILQIDDLSPPSIIPTQNITDDTFTASCLTTGTPKPSVTWYYKKDIKGPFSDLEAKGEEFKIKNINRNHFGIYKCVAENAIGKREEFFNFVVEERPKISANKTKYIALVGDSVLEIPCTVDGYPEPTIVWKNNDNKIINSDSKYEVKKVANHLYLRIKDLTLKDTSNFVCEASNSVGTTSKIFETYVTDDLQNDRDMYGNTFFVYILENDFKNIECNIPNQESTPVKKSVRWYKNGVLTNITGTKYPIMHANAADNGKYTCRVHKEHGSKSETSIVTVGTKPTFTVSYDLSMMLWLGDDNEFVDCTIKSPDNHTKVEWAYNGKITEEKGYKHPVKYEWGLYTCKVSNDFGIATRSINVTTDGCLVKKNVDINNNPPLISSFNIAFERDQSAYFVKNYVFMEIEQKMRIACHNPHNKNHFNIDPNEEYLIAECHGEDKFVVNDKVYKYSDIKCEKPVEVAIDNSHSTCTHNRSELINIGFMDSGGFIRTYRVCYDNELQVPIFTYAQISKSYLGNHVDNMKWVNIPNYKGVITTGCDNESKCCYGKEQLVNAADVTFGPHQAATFYEYNAVGVWKPCGNKSRTSWQVIEEKVRNVLDSHYNMEVWSGASGYEQQNIGMVPRYLWKVINSLGAIVYVNDPNPNDKDIKCSATIESLNHIISANDQFTYLCSIDEFSEVFNIPRNTFEQFSK